MANEQQNNAQMPEDRGVRQVVMEGNAQMQKPSTFRKAARIFFADDPVTAVKNFAATWGVPYIKHGLLNLAAVIIGERPMYNSGSFINGIVNSFTNAWTSNTQPYNTQATPYWAYGGPSGPAPVTVPDMRPGANFQGSLWFRDMYQAKAVYDEMWDVLRRCQNVRLADLYRAAGMPNNDYQSSLYWGWVDLTKMAVVSGKSTTGELGWVLLMPPIMAIR